MSSNDPMSYVTLLAILLGLSLFINVVLMVIIVGLIS